jgi:hypothetical protein
MFEQYRTFAEYIYDYELQRSEGLLLRHLNSVYKVLSQTVPDGVKNDEAVEIEFFLRELLTRVDSSLADEWERMRDPDYQPRGEQTSRAQELSPPGAEAAEADVTHDRKRFVAAIRTRIFMFLRAWSIGDHAGALASLDPPRDGTDDRAWSADDLKGALEAHRVEHAAIRFDPEARNLRHTHVSDTPDGGAWRVEQMLVDPDMHNDWVAEFEVNLEEARQARRPVLRLTRLGSLA